MAVVPLVINTVTMPAPAAVVWDLIDVLSDAGETTDALGYTHKDILAQKRWMQVRWTAVSIADMATILSTVNPGPYVQVTALDPMTGASRTMTATVSKRTAPMYNETLGLYESLTVEFTETGVAYTPPVAATYEGDAVIAHVLAGETFYSDSSTLLTGTMPDREGDNAATSSSVDGTTLKLVAPAGHYDGGDTVTLDDANFVAANIADGVTVHGLTGTMTSAPITYEIINPASLLNVVIPDPTYP